MKTTPIALTHAIPIVFNYKDANGNNHIAAAFYSNHTKTIDFFKFTKKENH